MEPLPIAAAKEAILAALKTSKFLVVVGDTGSGKTTQIPQYLLEAGYAPMAITQPRRVAATCVAARVGAMNSKDVVGYKVRFDTNVSRDTKLIFMTDGVLVRECVHDPMMTRYSTVMLDEAHERSVDTDVLFGLVKTATRRRDDLRCVVASATLDAERFSKYLDDCPVIRVPGRAFPVDVYHSKTQQTMTRFGPASRKYVDMAVDVVAQIHSSQPPGHVLVFLTGQNEIERACGLLRDLRGDMELRVLPLYGALPQETASRVFEDEEANVRKIVVATNIAETSITVPGIKYVVDSGYVKLKGFEPARSVASLTVVPISKVAAEQRAGRAGRTGPGQCYRLYSNACFDTMTPETIPEIKRTSMASVALALKSLDLDDVLAFDFLDPPDAAQLACALLELHALGALDKGPKLTDLGLAMTCLALEPNLARCLIQAKAYGQDHKVLTMCAALSAEDFFYSGPNDDKVNVTAARMKFRDRRGDLHTLCNVYEAFVKENSRGAAPWCRRHFLRLRALNFARRAREQLHTELHRIDWPVSRRPTDGDPLILALCSGLCLNAAERCLNEAYVLLPSPGLAYEHQLDNEKSGPNVALVRIDEETAAAFTSSPRTVCFHELRVAHNSRGSFAHNVVVVEPPSLLFDARARLGKTSIDDLCGRQPKQVVKGGRQARSQDDRLHEEEQSRAKAVDVDAARQRFLDRKKKQRTR